MGDAPEKSPLQRIAELFTTHGVEFLVIGGQAETLFGGARITFDIDCVIGARRTICNGLRRRFEN
jgi:hypothetical protein